MTKSVCVDVDVDIEFDDVLDYIDDYATQKELQKLFQILKKKLNRIEDISIRRGEILMAVPISNYGDYYELESLLTAKDMRFSTEIFLGD